MIFLKIVAFGFFLAVTGAMPQERTSGHLNRFIRSTVSCGTHEALDCDACEIEGKSPSQWCNGECQWDDGWFYDSCERKVGNSPAPKVNCGNSKEALTCKLCQEHDDDGTHSWCGGDCSWYDGYTFDACGQHGDLATKIVAGVKTYVIKEAGVYILGALGRK